MNFILSMIFSFSCYFAIYYFYNKQKSIYVAITTALMVLIISLMGMYIEIQKEEINKLESPCPEYEEIRGVYKLKQ